MSKLNRRRIQWLSSSHYWGFTVFRDGVAIKRWHNAEDACEHARRLPPPRWVRRWSPHWWARRCIAWDRYAYYELREDDRQRRIAQTKALKGERDDG